MRRQILWGALAVAGVILVIGAAVLGLARRQLVGENQDELLRQVEAAGSLIEREIAPLAIGELRRAVRSLELVKTIGGHDYVEAAVIGTNLYRALGDGAVLLPQLEQVQFDRGIFELEADGVPVLAGARVFDLTNSDRTDLRLLVVIGRKEPLLDPATVTRPLLLAVLIGAVVAVVLAVVLANRFGRRVTALAEASARLADGDTATRVPSDGDDELAMLGRAFNDMAAGLEDGRRREQEFLMSVGHDLRTPLTTIRGYAEALDAGTVEAGEIPRIAGVLHRQTDRLSRLIEDLMLLARLEAREFTIRPERVDLAAHVGEICASYRVRADEVHVRLESHVEPVGTVVVDPDRVAQVIGNLLDNALRYTPEGGRVTLGLSRSDGGIEVEVTDTGPGIDEEDLPRVFDRLHVAQRYRPVRPEGSGLGLAIVKEVVTALGGTIDVSSAPGEGTTFRVDLPARIDVQAREDADFS